MKLQIRFFQTADSFFDITVSFVETADSFVETADSFLKQQIHRFKCSFYNLQFQISDWSYNFLSQHLILIYVPLDSMDEKTHLPVLVPGGIHCYFEF